TVTATVTDQKGNPIAGAEVYKLNTGTTDPSDGTLVGYTDANGQVTDTEGAGTWNYYVNSDDDASYNKDTEYKDGVTITDYVAAMKSLKATSADGDAFDFDEYSAGDILATLTDQNGAGFAGQRVTYQWTVTPFDTSIAAHKLDQATTTDPTGADGSIA